MLLDLALGVRGEIGERLQHMERKKAFAMMKNIKHAQPHRDGVPPVWFYLEPVKQTLICRGTGKGRIAMSKREPRGGLKERLRPDRPKSMVGSVEEGLDNVRQVRQSYGIDVVFTRQTQRGRS